MSFLVSETFGHRFSKMPLSQLALTQVFQCKFYQRLSMSREQYSRQDNEFDCQIQMNCNLCSLSRMDLAMNV